MDSIIIEFRCTQAALILRHRQHTHPLWIASLGSRYNWRYCSTRAKWYPCIAKPTGAIAPQLRSGFHALHNQIQLNGDIRGILALCDSSLLQCSMRAIFQPPKFKSNKAMAQAAHSCNLSIPQNFQSSKAVAQAELCHTACRAARMHLSNPKP